MASGYLDSVEGEITFFRSIMRARPVGAHRHFHVIQVRTAIHRDTGVWVTVDEIWEKLRSCYEIETLDLLAEPGDREEWTHDADNNVHSPPSPQPDQNLAAHPYFEQEYSFPRTPSYEAILSARRMRDSISVDTPRELSPTPPPSPVKGKKKKTKSAKARASGLLPGESESSLTDQSMEDRGPDSPSAEAAVSGTEDVVSEGAPDEDVEMEVASPPAPSKPSIRTKETRSQQKKAPPTTNSASARTRSATAASQAKSKKKKK